MAKPKSPLLSLGARGSIGDTLTFQKRGRLTIARQKPIPTDPQTDLQLAQRQVYREAVAAWNALTIAEKQAYRGVCPGLTPYQCYMKTALLYVEPEPPPEEYTEEQTEHDQYQSIYVPLYPRFAQRLTIPDRRVIRLGFWTCKYGAPSGDVIFAIRRVSDDGIICSAVWGDAVDLPTVTTYEEVEFATPQTINEEVRLCEEFYGGSGEDFVRCRFNFSSVKAGEYSSRYDVDTWSPKSTWDTAYRYKYYEVE
ncbi:hypothetical protein ES708_30238 [subsurface metagenome]